MSSLRIAIHDYGGYPFIWGLSDALSRRGHDVGHFYFPQNNTPNAANHEVSGFLGQSYPITIAGGLTKYSFVRRYLQERAYGRAAAEAILAFQPDVILSANAPLDAQRRIMSEAAAQSVPTVFWLQDVLSIAARKTLDRKLPGLGWLVGGYFRQIERRLLRDSAAIVAIAPDFLPICKSFGVALERTHVILNWANLADIQPRPRKNAWSDRHGLSERRTILYSGSIGLKHDPRIFEHLSRAFADQPDVAIVVVSEGLGAQWLAARKKEAGLANLIILGYQPYGELSEVLASGDVLMAALERDAGVFCVPSKVLTYLTAGRPVLLSVPLNNLAAATVREANAGLTITPGDDDGLAAAALTLMGDEALRRSMGENGREYAERVFAIEKIATRFENILMEAVGEARTGV
jgi:glycosyltransferase involved in cell wall biosynthesis